MANKLWEKDFEINSRIERFTVGRDTEMDLYLAPFDVLGSMAHITMLASIGLLKDDELKPLLAELKNIYKLCQEGKFVIEDGVEDVHSQVELMLTRKLGDIGKKIHSGRSRNDQVSTDFKLYMRHRAAEIRALVVELQKNVLDVAKKNFGKIMPGYTHLQQAQPILFSHYFCSSFGVSVVKDSLTTSSICTWNFRSEAVRLQVLHSHTTVSSSQKNSALNVRAQTASMLFRTAIWLSNF